MRRTSVQREVSAFKLMLRRNESFGFILHVGIDSRVLHSDSRISEEKAEWSLKGLKELIGIIEIGKDPEKSYRQT